MDKLIMNQEYNIATAWNIESRIVQPQAPESAEKL